MKLLNVCLRTTPEVEVLSFQVQREQKERPSDTGLTQHTIKIYRNGRRPGILQTAHDALQRLSSQDLWVFDVSPEAYVFMTTTGKFTKIKKPQSPQVATKVG